MRHRNKIGFFGLLIHCRILEPPAGEEKINGSAVTTHRVSCETRAPEVGLNLIRLRNALDSTFPSWFIDQQSEC